MKVAAYFNANVTTGGGFQQSLNAALQMQKICNGLYDFTVYTPIKSNLEVLEDLGLPGIYCPYRFLDKIFSLMARSAFFDRVQGKIRILSNFERQLMRDGVDLVYFLAPLARASSLMMLNYIITVWDLCHRDFPEFPEVSSFCEFERRESLYKSVLAKAYLVIADSDELKQKLVNYYSIDPQRILEMPFQPMQACSSSKNSGKDDDIIKGYDLSKGYLFYPAQFWSHKGHIRLLQALSMYRKRHRVSPTCVFSGGDTGNLRIVMQAASAYGLNDCVRFLGFIPNEHIPTFYRCSSALVMPTYFGPTNLPPLEAMSLGVPVIYPDHLRNQCGEAAIYFDIDDAESLCDAIERILGERNEGFEAEGYKRLTQINDDRRISEEKLAKKLREFSKRIQCWQEG